MNFDSLPYFGSHKGQKEGTSPKMDSTVQPESAALTPAEKAKKRVAVEKQLAAKFSADPNLSIKGLTLIANKEISDTEATFQENDVVGILRRDKGKDIYQDQRYIGWRQAQEGGSQENLDNTVPLKQETIDAANAATLGSPSEAPAVPPADQGQGESEPVADEEATREIKTALAEAVVEPAAPSSNRPADLTLEQKAMIAEEGADERSDFSTFAALEIESTPKTSQVIESKGEPTMSTEQPKAGDTQPMRPASETPIPAPEAVASTPAQVSPEASSEFDFSFDDGDTLPLSPERRKQPENTKELEAEIATEFFHEIQDTVESLIRLGVKLRYDSKIHRKIVQAVEGLTAAGLTVGAMIMAPEQAGPAFAIVFGAAAAGKTAVEAGPYVARGAGRVASLIPEALRGVSIGVRTLGALVAAAGEGSNKRLKEMTHLVLEVAEKPVERKKTADRIALEKKIAELEQRIKEQAVKLESNSSSERYQAAIRIGDLQEKLQDVKGKLDNSTKITAIGEGLQSAVASATADGVLTKQEGRDLADLFDDESERSEEGI